MMKRHYVHCPPAYLARESLPSETLSQKVVPTSDDKHDEDAFLYDLILEISSTRDRTAYGSIIVMS